jgi:hypothetical protein
MRTLQQAQRQTSTRTDCVMVQLDNGWVTFEQGARFWTSHYDGSIDLLGGSERHLPAGFWKAISIRLPGGNFLVELAAEERAA